MLFLKYILFFSEYYFLSSFQIKCEPNEKPEWEIYTRLIKYSHNREDSNLEMKTS